MITANSQASSPSLSLTDVSLSLYSHDRDLPSPATPTANQGRQPSSPPRYNHHQALSTLSFAETRFSRRDVDPRTRSPELLLSSRITTGTGILKQQAVTNLSKWSCLVVTLAWVFFFMALFYLTLLVGSKNKRR
ncbi:ABC transporter G family member 20 [Platanthera zijinensis]|uniref:ABC transporter G family member 20 n=1 Tax=Platanthera zijinensis TaxID=2320716 RepID=A0AAP0G0N8_9ASPA